MAYQPLKLIKNKNQTGQLNVGNTSQSKNVSDAISRKTELEKERSNGHTKTSINLGTTTELLTHETCKLKRRVCCKQFNRKEVPASQNAVTKRQKKFGNKVSAGQTLQSCSTKESSQPINKETETPRLAMESVGKRNAKKRHCDDFIRYDLNTKQTKSNPKLTTGAKTGSKVKEKQKADEHKSTQKKSAENPNKKCRLNSKKSKTGVKLEECLLTGEKEEENSRHEDQAVAEVVHDVIKTATMKGSNVCEISGHKNNYSCLINLPLKGADVSKTVSILSGLSTKPAMSRHLRIRNSKSTTFLRCVTCRIFFLWKKPFLNHLKVHQNKLPFECVQCRKRFLSFFNYISHMRDYHSPRKAHCCHKCGKRYTSMYLLTLHWSRHKKSGLATKYLCNICDTSFPYKYFLSKHLAKEHNKCTDRTSVSLTCKSCGTSFRDRRQLWIHQRKHQKHAKKYKCHLCDRSFAMQKWLTDHVQRHVPERNYSCSVCNKCYFTKTDAAMHERRHTKEAAFVCSECNKKFIYRSELNAHTKKHQGIRLPKNIICNVCHKAFYTRRDLDRHLTVHTGEKPYKCNVCSKCFSQEINMHVHAKIHTGDRPYQCDLCDKKFPARSKLTRHRRCHVTSKGLLQRPFKCVLCPKKYTTENSLIRHLRTHRDSHEIVTNIKAALKIASEESNSAQATTGAVLACMIDQAILDARRMAHSRKSQGANNDPSLAEIIDQAIHDSKTTSSTQTPKAVENCGTFLIDKQLSPSDTSQNTELAQDTTKDTTISEAFTDISTHSCSDIIKLISDILSKHTETSNKFGTKGSALPASIGNPSTQTVLVIPKESALPAATSSIGNPSTQTVLIIPKESALPATSSIGNPSTQTVLVVPKESALSATSSIGNPSTTQTVLVVPKSTALKPDQFLWLSKQDGQNWQIGQQVATSNSQISPTNSIASSSDILSGDSAMKLALAVCNDQQVFVDSLNLSTEVHSFLNNLVMPGDVPDSTSPQQQVIFLDAFCEDSGILHPSSLSSFNQQQNILSINGKSALVMVSLPSGKDLRAALQNSSVSDVHQSMLPLGLTSLSKKRQAPTNSGTNSQAVPQTTSNP